VFGGADCVDHRHLVIHSDDGERFSCCLPDGLRAVDCSSGTKRVEDRRPELRTPGAIIMTDE
jgi:hypothetical protein